MAVGKTYLRIACRADVHAKDMAGRKTGLHQLMTGQAPEVHGTGFGVKPRTEALPPLLIEMNELRPGRTKARSSYGQKVPRRKPVTLAEAMYGRLREAAAVASPAHMQSGNVTSASMRQQNGLTVCRLDAQGQTGPVGRHAVSFRYGLRIRSYRFGVEKQSIAVHLP